MYASSKLAEFVSDTKYEDLSEIAIASAERAILDTIASIIGGVATDNARLSRMAAKAVFGAGSATAWFTGASLHPLGAVFANCAAASALDIDDGHRLAAGHPGGAIVPAVLIEAAARRSGGRDVLAATAIGYDVALRIAAARRFSNSMSFASGQWTGFGVAAAIGWLRGLSPDCIANAMAIASAEAPQNLPQGDCKANSVKGSSPWSTVTAFVGIERAAVGMSGPIDLLDRAHAYDGTVIFADLGQRWLIGETYLKPYAACRYTHPAIDAVLALVAALGQNATIDQLIVEIFPEAGKLPNEPAPKSLEAAQFSVPFTAALAALRGAGAFRPLRPSALVDPDVLALAARVDLRYAKEFAGVFPGRTPARVTIVSAGRELAKTVQLPLGEPGNPMDSAAVQHKLHDLGRELFSGTDLDSVVAATAQLKLENSAPLFACLELKPIANSSF
jgi:2-methylcitrate dehydratase PrpD